MGDVLNFGALDCIYFSMLGVGFIYALIVLVAGGVHEIGAPDIDLDIGDVDVGGMHLGDVGGHIEVGHAPSFDHGDVGVTPLSPITIASFVTAFGAIGLVATQLFAVNARFSLVWAAVGALTIAIIVHFAFGYFLIAPQGTTQITRRDIIGATAEVTVPIPDDGVGQVAYTAQGGRVTSSARSADGSSIKRGTAVVIEDMVGSAVIVRGKQ